MDETLKSMVARILKKDNLARENDVWLYLQVLIEQGYAEESNGKIIIKTFSIETMTKPEAVSRVRRYFQNDKHLYEADEETIRERMKHSVENKEYWGNKQGGETQGLMANSQYS